MLDAAPSLGRDLGGPLGAVPGVLVLAMLLARVRVTAARMGAVLVAAAAVVTGVAVARLVAPGRRCAPTWAGFVRAGPRRGGGHRGGPQGGGEPAGRRSAGRCRCCSRSPRSPPRGWSVPGSPLRGGCAAHRGGGGAAPRGSPRSPLALAIGTVVNDSGVAVTAAAAALLVPLERLGPPSAAGETVAAAQDGRAAVPSDPAGTGRRVTVGSRGSTVWNA